jgi:hypothetical protein
LRSRDPHGVESAGVFDNVAEQEQVVAAVASFSVRCSNAEPNSARYFFVWRRTEASLTPIALAASPSVVQFVARSKPNSRMS